MLFSLVQFSKKNPQLLAIGLYDGSIEILDITEESSGPVAKTARLTSPVVEPIWKIVWLAGKKVEQTSVRDYS
jgi:dynein intermediate chain 4, axonemal